MDEGFAPYHLACPHSLSFLPLPPSLSLSPPPSLCPALIADSQYKYTDQLLELEACSSNSNEALPAYLCQVVTPLKLEAWRKVLSSYPDLRFAPYILRGVEQGFRIGYNPHLVKLQPARVLSSRAARGGREYLLEELSANRIVRVNGSDTDLIHCSPFGVIPKRSRQNKWRLIVDLSSPDGHCVNDGIGKDLSSLSYVSVEDVVAGIIQRGRGTLLAKMDICKAYRNVPIHPHDKLLLGMQWQGVTFADATLPFGLRSASLIFSAIADALQWVMELMGVRWVAHYIDDFITMGAPGSEECVSISLLMHMACAQMGLPVEPDKDEGPASTLSFLGIELGNGDPPPPGEAHSPPGGDSSLEGLCKKRELLSLIGLLSHACKEVRSGRSFLRRLIDLSTIPKHLEHYVHLNLEARSVIEWWAQYLQGCVHDAPPQCGISGSGADVRRIR